MQHVNASPGAKGLLLVRMLTWRALAVWLAIGVAVLSLSTQRPGAARASQEDEAAACAAEARGQGSLGTVLPNLRVRIEVAAQPGVALAPGLATPAPRTLGPLADACVRVTPALRPDQPLAARISDAAGEVGFALPSGDYWVFLPALAALPGWPGAVPTGANLPDGQGVLAWAAVTIAAEEPRELVLPVTVLGV